MGWRGLCIDANPVLIDKFASIRPEDRAECACVGTATGTSVHFVISKDPALSHVAHAALPESNDPYSVSVAMPIVTLSSLMTKHSIPRIFGVLTIDVEGIDVNFSTA